MLPSKFQVNWLIDSGGEAKNRFSRWRPWWPSLISDRNDFSYFSTTSTPMLLTKCRAGWPKGVGGVGFKANC